MYAAVVLHALAHDSGESSRYLFEEQGRESPSQEAQAWSTFLDFPHRTECLWGVIAWNNIQISVSGKVDWAAAAL